MDHGRKEGLERVRKERGKEGITCMEHGRKVGKE